MVEVYVVYVESPKHGNKGYLSRNTRKSDEGIIVEFNEDIISGNPKSDICAVVSYFTRGSAIKTKDLIVSEVLNKNPDAEIIADVKPLQISLADSRSLNSKGQWVYK